MSIERSIDKLGRIVLPIKYREKLGIKTDDKVIINLDGETITVSPAKSVCALCGNSISKPGNIRICNACVNKIKEEREQG